MVVPIKEIILYFLFWIFYWPNQIVQVVIYTVLIATIYVLIVD